MTIQGQVVDEDGDSVGDRIEATESFSDGSHQAVTFVRTNEYDDYRCFGGLGGGCRPALDTPSCSYILVSGTRYDVSARIPFRDDDADLNPNPAYNALFFRTEQVGSAGGFTAPIPGTNTIYNLSVSATGSTTGEIDFAATNFEFHMNPDPTIRVGFQVYDVAGHISQKVYCATVPPV